MTDGELLLLKPLVQAARERGASDLHLEAGTRAVVARVRGELQPLGASPSGERLLQARQELLVQRGLELSSAARLGRPLARDRGRALPGELLPDLARHGDRGPPAVTRRSRDLRACNLHPDLRRSRRGATGLVIMSGPTGCGQVDHARGARRGDQCLARAPHHHARKPARIPVHEPPVASSASARFPRHSPSFEQAIVDAHAREPRRARDQRDAHAGGHAPDAERGRDRAPGAGHDAFGELRGGAEPDLHVVSGGDPGQHPRAARRLPGGRRLPAAGLSRVARSCGSRAARCCSESAAGAKCAPASSARSPT